MGLKDLYNNKPWFGKANTQIPGWASVSNLLGNLRPGFAFGFTGNLGAFREGGFRGTPFNTTMKDLGNGVSRRAWDPQLSIGGILSSGYGAVGGALAGAGIGAVTSSFIEGGNPVIGAGIGAGVGAVTMMAGPIMAGAAARGGWELIKRTPKILSGIGKAGISAARGIGSTINKGLAGMADIMVGAGSGSVLSTLNPVTRYGSALAGIASKMITKNPEVGWLGTIQKLDNGVLKYKKGVELSGLGKAALVGGFMFEGMKDAFREFERQKMGRRDNYVTGITPSINLPADGGASGDLVFALNTLRNGS